MYNFTGAMVTSELQPNLHNSGTFAKSFTYLRAPLWTRPNEGNCSPLLSSRITCNSGGKERERERNNTQGVSEVGLGTVITDNKIETSLRTRHEAHYFSKVHRLQKHMLDFETARLR